MRQKWSNNNYNEWRIIRNKTIFQSWTNINIIQDRRSVLEIYENYQLNSEQKSKEMIKDNDVSLQAIKNIIAN